MQIQFIRHLLPCEDQENIRIHAKHVAIQNVQSLLPLSLIDPSRRSGLQENLIAHNTLHEESRESGHQGGQEVDTLVATRTIARATAYSRTYRTVDVWWQAGMLKNIWLVFKRQRRSPHLQHVTAGTSVHFLPRQRNK